MYKSAEEEVARLEAQQGTKFEEGYTAGFEDGFAEAQADRSGEM
jgi:flagellar biosynthesis/type III secretory pathway protein FliH